MQKPSFEVSDLGDEIEPSELQSMPLIILGALAILSGLTGGFLVLEVYTPLVYSGSKEIPGEATFLASCLATITLPLFGYAWLLIRRFLNNRYVELSIEEIEEIFAPPSGKR